MDLKNTRTIIIQQVMISSICCDIAALVNENKVIIEYVVDHESLETYSNSFLFNSNLWQDNIKRNNLLQLFKNKWVRAI